MRVKMLRVNALLITSAILAGVIVGIGACCQRYRHRPFTRFIYLGASTLFLPIISSVFSLSAKSSDYIMPSKSRGSSLIVKCNPTGHEIQVVTWAFLVQIIIINTSVVVATDDREGQNIGPPIELLLQGVWAMYLGILYINSIPITSIHITGIDNITVIRIFIIIATIFYAVVPFALTCTKIMFKYYAFQKARRSFELGRNPLLIFGYMQQLQQEETNRHGDLQVDEDASPPPLLVTGEGRGHMVEMKPCGYVFKAGS
ncbi:hypothetical protein C2845_PM09G11630 [Panicum miliaceum]|uniref:Uncharacterized protein n=1 Tax=Panicum miliaceum TaxID=4540 RepID=A0A3L6S4Y2_PANMI|nr:hypothetical protein C2845_PM09G11630 [Panicum miliaceum]